ncbi:MAG: guanylate kinase [Chloroflexi bacterium]|nr:MAG: guanylate kinase [Chloroflexota bacterium]
MKKGLLIVISGPSAVGKDTILRRLLEMDPKLRYSVSATTRPPRPGEIDGANYTFVTREQFQRLVEEGSFLEHAEYAGNLYGTLGDRVAQAREAGYDIVLKIDVQGAEQVRQKIPDGVFIFVVPPSMQELERRQTMRDSEAAEARAARRKIAEQEMAYSKHFDHIVVNDDVDRAAEEMFKIIQNARERQT